jgi:hypothetical protein
MVSDTKGTWPFWSPEMVDDDNKTNRYSAYAADVWAAGICLWIFIYGTLPFWSAAPHDIFNLILQTKTSFPEVPSQKSPEFHEILQKMLEPDAKLRPSFEDCENLTWIQKYTVIEVERKLSRASSSVVDRKKVDTANALTAGEVSFISDKIFSKLGAWGTKSKQEVKRRTSQDQIEDENATKLATTASAILNESPSCSPNNSRRNSRASSHGEPDIFDSDSEVDETSSPDKNLKNTQNRTSRSSLLVDALTTSFTAIRRGKSPPPAERTKSSDKAKFGEDDSNKQISKIPPMSPKRITSKTETLKGLFISPQKSQKYSVNRSASDTSTNSQSSAKDNECNNISTDVHVSESIPSEEIPNNVPSLGESKTDSSSNSKNISLANCETTSIVAGTEKEYDSDMQSIQQNQICCGIS